MTKRQKMLINRIKELYEEHDHSETLIVMAIRRMGWQDVFIREKMLVQHHDDLEHLIMREEAELTHCLAEKLKKGEL